MSRIQKKKWRNLVTIKSALVTNFDSYYAHEMTVRRATQKGTGIFVIDVARESYLSFPNVPMNEKCQFGTKFLQLLY